MKDTDPEARYIAFLREFNWRYRDKIRGVSKSTEFIQDVLRGLPMVDDFSLHFYYDGETRPGGKFMHIQDVVNRINRVLSVAAGVRGEKPLHVWVTEHSRRLTVNSENEQKAKSYTSNLQAALSTADFLTAMTQIPQVKATALQALNGVGRQVFDASVQHADLRPRPVYWAMRILNYGRRGAVLSTETQSPHTSGYPGGYDVRAAALSNQSAELTVWVVNRALTPMASDIVYRPLKAQEVELQHYYLAGQVGINADIVGDGVFDDLDHTRIGIDFDFADMAAVRIGRPRRQHDRRLVETEFHTGRHSRRGVGRFCDFLEGYLAIGTRNGELAIIEGQRNVNDEQPVKVVRKVKSIEELRP